MMLILIALQKAIFEVQILARHRVAESTLHYLSKSFRRGSLIGIVNHLPTKSVDTLCREVNLWYSLPRNKKIVEAWIKSPLIK